MSHEPTKSSVADAKFGFLDQETALVIIDGKCAIQISLPSEEEALEKKKKIEDDKFCLEEDYMLCPTYRLSSNYSISIKGNDVIIQGPLKELIAAIHRLHAYGYHISQQKSDQLLEEITQIHIKEVTARERQARKEKRSKTTEEKFPKEAAKTQGPFFPKSRTTATKMDAIPTCGVPPKLTK